MAGEWKHYRGKWHGSYYMISGKMFAHVTRFGDSIPQIVVRVPGDAPFQVLSLHPCVHDMESARIRAELRLAALYPEHFAQSEMEL